MLSAKITHTPRGPVRPLPLDLISTKNYLLKCLHEGVKRLTHYKFKEALIIYNVTWSEVLYYTKGLTTSPRRTFKQFEPGPNEFSSKD